MREILGGGGEGGGEGGVGVGVDVNAKGGERGTTALHLACRAGRADASRLLIERGADVEAKSWYGYMPLPYASSCAYGSSVGFLQSLRQG